MAKTSGLGERLYVGQYDLSGDIGALSNVADVQNLMDVTPINKSAIERITLLKDGSLGFHAFWDTTAGQEHPVLKAMPGTDAVWTWLMGTAVGSPTGSLIAKLADYPLTRAQDGSLVIDPTVQANGYGIEWGNLLTSGAQTFASAAAGTKIDDYYPVFVNHAPPVLALPSPYGLSAYLHALSIGSGTATVAIQDSTDDLSYSNVTGAVFTAVTGATSQRIQTTKTQNVNRYLRVNVSGTFTNLVAVVAVHRYVTHPTK